MPIFHNYKCIFVHIPKTGGVSITHMMSPLNDQSFDINKDDLETLIGHSYSHKNMTSIKFYLDEKIVNSYFKFAVMRDPYDRLVSFIKWSRKKEDQIHAITIFKFALKSFLDLRIFRLTHFVHTMLKPQHWFICDKNKNCLVNYIIDFDDFDQGWSYVKKKCGIKSEMCVKNKSNKKISSNPLNMISRLLVRVAYNEDYKLYKKLKCNKIIYSSTKKDI